MNIKTTDNIATMQTQCIDSTLTCFLLLCESLPCALTVDCNVNLCANKLMII